MLQKQTLQGKFCKGEELSEQVDCKTWQPWQPPCSNAKPCHFSSYPWLQNCWMKWNSNLSRIVALKQVEQVIWNNNNSQAHRSVPIQCFAKLLQINRPCPFRGWAADGTGKFLGGSGWLFIFLLWEGTAIKYLFKSVMISRREVLWDVLPLPPREKYHVFSSQVPTSGAGTRAAGPRSCWAQGLPSSNMLSWGHLVIPTTLPDGDRSPYVYLIKAVP